MSDYPRGPPTFTPGLARQAHRAPRPPSLGRPGASLGAAHTPVGEPRRRGAAEPAARDHSPQYAEFSSSTTTRGHISATAAGSLPTLPPPPTPPPESGTAAAVTIKTHRPGCWAARTRAPVPPAPPARASRARALALALAPAPVAADSGPPNSRTRVHAPAGSAETQRPLPGGGAGQASWARSAALSQPSPAACRRLPLEAELVCSRTRGTSLHLPLSAAPFLFLTPPWAPLSSPGFHSHHPASGTRPGAVHPDLAALAQPAPPISLLSRTSRSAARVDPDAS